MDQIWAPWRMAFLKKTDKVKCFFCTYSRQKTDRKNLILRRGKHAFVILNRYPYNNGHLLIAPYRHVGTPEKLNEREVLEMHTLTVEMKKQLDKKLKAQGYNLGTNLGRMAGAGVPGHLHLHIVPRWKGDTNFMPAVGNTKVMPMALEALYDTLKKTPHKGR